MAVTMKDVARHLGVSMQTVSAVINGRQGISAGTIEKVQRAIAELGYQPNLVAASLAGRRSSAVGLFVGSVANPWFGELARGVEDVAQSRGYVVILCNSDAIAPKEHAYVQLLGQYQVAGAVGVVSAEDITWPFPFVAAPDLDDRRGGYVATAHLLDLGHQRIGFILPEAAHQPGAAANRLAGYQAALADWSIPFDRHLVVEAAGRDYASGRRAAFDLLAQHNPPTAIFGFDDVIALGALAGIERAGVRVPDDVAVIGYGALDITALSGPPLTAVAMPVYALGGHIMTRLADELEGSATPATQLLPECELIVRGSTVAGLIDERRCGPISGQAPWAAWRSEKGGAQTG